MNLILIIHLKYVVIAEEMAQKKERFIYRFLSISV